MKTLIISAVSKINEPLITLPTIPDEVWTAYEAAKNAAKIAQMPKSVPGLLQYTVQSTMKSVKDEIFEKVEYYEGMAREQLDDIRETKEQLQQMLEAKRDAMNAQKATAVAVVTMTNTAGPVAAVPIPPVEIF